MARNGFERNFRSSKMAAGSHFVKIKKKSVAYWSEMARNVIESDFRSSKMAAGSHFVSKKKVAYWSEMVRNAFEIHFRSSKMGGGGHHNDQAVNQFFYKLFYWQRTHALKSTRCSPQPFGDIQYTQYLPLRKYTNSSLHRKLAEYITCTSIPDLVNIVLTSSILNTGIIFIIWYTFGNINKQLYKHCCQYLLLFYCKKSDKIYDLPVSIYIFHYICTFSYHNGRITIVWLACVMA